MIPVLAAVPNVLSGFNTYSAPLLFRGLTESIDGRPPALSILGWLFLAAGLWFVLIGDTMRIKGKDSNESFDERIKTWILVVLIFGCSQLMAVAAGFGDAVLRETGLGTPTGLATGMITTAYSMPELTTMFDMIEASNSQTQARQSDKKNRSAQQDKEIMDALDGSAWGYVSAFGRAMLQTGANGAREVIDKADDTVSAVLHALTLFEGFCAAMVKILAIFCCMIIVTPALLIASAVMWFMEQLRYFFIVAGTVMLPLFVGAFSLPPGHFFRNTAQNYVMNLISIALWPIAWAIGHSGTMALFNSWTGLIAGTTTAGNVLKAYLVAKESLQNPGLSAADIQHMYHNVMADWMAGNFLHLLAIPLGAIGLSIWMIWVTVYAPKLLHGMLTTGAQFMTEAAKGVGSTTAQVAGSAAQIAATVMSGGAAAALAPAVSAAGGALSGAASGGIGGALSGAASSFGGATNLNVQRGQGQEQTAEKQLEATESLSTHTEHLANALENFSGGMN
jgi:hypothetical protein